MSQSLQPMNQENSCRQVAGTVFRIFIPAGAAINILNLVELTSPSGICLILRLPFLSGECKPNCHNYDNMFDAIRRAGGTVEAVDRF
jgi:hypothetical protein